MKTDLHFRSYLAQFFGNLEAEFLRL